MKQDIEARFQTLITISLFYPVLLYNMATIVGQNDQQALLASIRVSAVFALFVFDYILYQARKKTLSDRSLIRVGECLLLALGIFIVPIICIVLATFPTSLAWLQVAVAMLMSTSFLCVVIFPPLLEVVILFSPDKKKAAPKRKQDPLPSA